MKVKCTLCGKVGILENKRSLKRHMRLAHGKSSAEGFFEPADSDSIVEIMSTSKKSYRKQANVEANKKWRSQRKRELREKYGPLEHKSIYWGSVLKSAFETK